jgi:hypothetical protein
MGVSARVSERAVLRDFQAGSEKCPLFHLGPSEQGYCHGLVSRGIISLERGEKKRLRCNWWEAVLTHAMLERRFCVFMVWIWIVCLQGLMCPVAGPQLGDVERWKDFRKWGLVGGLKAGSSLLWLPVLLYYSHHHGVLVMLCLDSPWGGGAKGFFARSGAVIFRLSVSKTVSDTTSFLCK